MTNAVNINVSETKHAMRVNGVTIAKKHLHRCFPDSESANQAIFQYLTLVPFLTEKAEILLDRFTGHTRYCAIKAARIYKVLGLTKVSCIPFMLVCLERAGDLDEGEGAELAKAFGMEVVQGSSEQEIANKLGKRMAANAVNDIFRKFNSTVSASSKPTMH